MVLPPTVRILWLVSGVRGWIFGLISPCTLIPVGGSVNMRHAQLYIAAVRFSAVVGGVGS